MKNPFGKTYTPEEIRQFEFLRQFDLFQKLTEKELLLFLPHLHERSYVQDEAVFFRNDPSHALYLLKKGKVTLTLDVNERFEELGVLVPPTVLGDNCLLRNTKRPMNAVVTSETALFTVIPQDNLFDLFEARPEIHMKMVEAFAQTNEGYLKRMFKEYRSSFGLFNLAEVFKN